ncbi:carbohydrate ABC transporter permease [Cohnella sp. 56]|uniref:carbohydrate ABC transporter permease n=1 Tax=Cohnella sp. 56 TaxID=3113722 RepID=UPI0030EA5335
MSMRRKWGHGLANLLLAAASLCILAPVLLIVNVALKSNNEFLNRPSSFVESWEWENFGEAWKQAEMGLYFKNSVLFTVVVALGTCIIATMAAYPIARKHFRGTNVLYLMFLSALFLPVALVPQVMLMKYLGFLNTYHGFIMLKIGGSLAIAIFILTGFIKGLPKELDEAAVVDGCGYLRYIFTFVFPLTKSALSTVAMLTGIGTWNDFINPFLFLTDKDMRPLTAGLYMFFGQYSTNWTIMAAGIIVVASPLMAAYFLLQRYIISGVTSGAVKG